MLEYENSLRKITPAQVDIFVKAKGNLRLTTSGEFNLSSAVPDLKKIVTLGEPAIPLILDELSRGPSWIFIALEEITGENPISETGSDSLEEINEGWLRWGDEHGYGKLIRGKIIFKPS